MESERVQAKENLFWADETRCSHILRQGGVLPGAGSSVVGWLWEEWLSALDNIKQLYDKNCLSTRPDWSQFSAFLPCPTAVAIYHRREHQRLSVSSYSDANSLTCVCVNVRSGRTERVFLGATQLQITHQITPIMIKAKERGFTFSSCSLCTLSERAR